MVHLELRSVRNGRYLRRSASSQVRSTSSSPSISHRKDNDIGLCENASHYKVRQENALIRGFWLFGAYYPAEKWVTVLEAFLVAICTRFPGSEEELLSGAFPRRKWIINGRAKIPESGRHQLIPGTTLYVIRNKGSAEIRAFCYTTLRYLGYSADELKFVSG